MKTFRSISVSALVLVLGMTFAGVSNARPQSSGMARVKMAVTEFSPASSVPPMTHEAKRHMQASLAYALAETKRFHVVDVRNTREASQADLASINGGSSTAPAVRLGKQMGVAYVLTGTIEEYTPQGGDGFGQVRLTYRLIDVATGKVVHAGNVNQRSTAAMRTTGVAEMHSRTMRPALEKLAATLAGVM